MTRLKKSLRVRRLFIKHSEMKEGPNIKLSPNRSKKPYFRRVLLYD